MAGKKKIQKEAEPVKKENTFSKRQLLTAERFRERKDILDVLLMEGRRYTISDVEQKIEKYMKGKVN